MPCCGCCGNGFLFGHLMYILEKLAAFCAMSAIISCIVVTVLISIGIGVGVGYNYCFVDSKTSKLTAIEQSKNSKNPAKLPQSPNAFPFSGESSNETETDYTTINYNTIIEHPPPTEESEEEPTFPDVPDIPVSVFPETPPTFSVGVPDVTILSTSESSPVLPSSPSVVHPTTTQAPIIHSPPGGETFPDSAHHGTMPKINPTSSAPKISSPHSSAPEISSPDSIAPEISFPDNSAPEIPSPDSSPPEIPSPDSSAPEISFPDSSAPEIPSPDSSPPEIPSPDSSAPEISFPDSSAPEISSPDSSAPEISSPDSSTPESFPNIPPHSPFFSGSYRRIPTILKDRPVSELKPGRLNLQRLKVRPLRVKTPGKFDANHDDVDFGEVKQIEDTHYTEELKDRPTVRKAKYRRRKPAQRNPIIKKLTKATTVMPTIVIPLKKYANLSPLLSKILAQNKNVTLQFITL
ncbi:hypothetical protein ABMA28_016764 [Loxostege sticticalis]|uniref:Uncharacterized protein n=1 Tax=Loxostege sticticalis TaxID=481309 RepID=A0ABD0T5S4_LOXSC